MEKQAILQTILHPFAELSLILHTIFFQTV